MNTSMKHIVYNFEYEYETNITPEAVRILSTEGLLETLEAYICIYVYMYIIDGNMYNLPLYIVAQGRSGSYPVSG